MEVNQNLKLVLKNYQHSAVRSLQGPGLGDKYDPDIEDDLPEVPVQRVRQRQIPILAAPDNTCSERTETVLGKETISCFVVGGEKRLSLPQVLSTVLCDFTLQQINQECDKLQIFCSRCTFEQLNELKTVGILPKTAHSCGLITQTDAERLCSALVHGRQSGPPLRIGRNNSVTFKVYHECFGGCEGICVPDLYTDKYARCIECSQCQCSYTPQQFVLHVHGEGENRTVHWGFDSTSWRSYTLVDETQTDHKQYYKYLDDMRDQFEGKTPFAPPPRIDNNMANVKRKVNKKVGCSFGSRKDLL